MDTPPPVIPLTANPLTAMPLTAAWLLLLPSLIFRTTAVGAVPVDPAGWQVVPVDCAGLLLPRRVCPEGDLTSIGLGGGASLTLCEMAEHRG